MDELCQYFDLSDPICEAANILDNLYMKSSNKISTYNVKIEKSGLNLFLFFFLIFIFILIYFIFILELRVRIKTHEHEKKDMKGYRYIMYTTHVSFEVYTW